MTALPPLPKLKPIATPVRRYGEPDFGDVEVACPEPGCIDGWVLAEAWWSPWQVEQRPCPRCRGWGAVKREGDDD